MKNTFCNAHAFLFNLKYNSVAILVRFMKTKLGHMIIYFAFLCLFYLKSLCLMRALVKIGFYYHKQHLRSEFNYIYFYFKPRVYFFSQHQYLFSLYLFSITMKLSRGILYFKYIRFSFQTRQLEIYIECLWALCKYKRVLFIFS